MVLACASSSFQSSARARLAHRQLLPGSYAAGITLIGNVRATISRNPRGGLAHKNWPVRSAINNNWSTGWFARRAEGKVVRRPREAGYLRVRRNRAPIARDRFASAIWPASPVKVYRANRDDNRRRARYDPDLSSRLSSKFKRAGGRDVVVYLDRLARWRGIGALCCASNLPRPNVRTGADTGEMHDVQFYKTEKAKNTPGIKRVSNFTADNRALT